MGEVSQKLNDNTSMEKTEIEVYVKKLSSLNPDAYRLILISEALALYDKYLRAWSDEIEKRGSKIELKSLKRWLETEI